MQYELIFLRSLIEYWRIVRAEWYRYSRGDIHARSPLEISHPLKDRPPKEFEEVVLQFLDDYFRREPKPQQVSASGVTLPQYPKFAFPPRVFHVPVTVRAESGSHGTLVKLTVRIEKEAYAEFGKAALSRWNKIKSAWQRKGWLTDPLAQIQQRVVKRKKPAKPKIGSHLNLWFDYYHNMRAAQFNYTFKDLSRDSGHTAGHLANIHGNYKKERGLT